MKNPPGVTVVMATYNGAAYVREQLDSLAQQTVLPTELIVGDDGSKDATLPIVEEFARTAPFPVTILRNPCNLGYSNNFLNAATHATTDYIAFSDQDDVWLPTKLERCLQALENPNVLLVAHGTQPCDVNLQPLEHTRFGILEDRYVARMQGDPFLVPPGHVQVFASHLVRALAWQHRPPSHIMAIMSHDQWVPFLAHVLGDTQLLGEKLVLYRQHQNNAFGSHHRTLSEEMNRSAQAGSTHYDRVADTVHTWVETLKALAAQSTPPEARMLREGATLYQRVERTLRGRAAMYRQRIPPLRLGNYLPLLLSGSYRSRWTGGLGARALAEDTAHLLLP